MYDSCVLILFPLQRRTRRGLELARRWQRLFGWGKPCIVHREYKSHVVSCHVLRKSFARSFEAVCYEQSDAGSVEGSAGIRNNFFPTAVDRALGWVLGLEQGRGGRKLGLPAGLLAARVIRR